MTPAPAVEIRRFRMEDSEAVWSLHNRALEGTGAHLGNGVWDQDVRDPASHYLERGGEFLVGFSGGELVVMGAFVPIEGSAIEIKRMRVRPSVQRQGLGKLLLSALESRAIVQGYTVAKLDTARQQIAAQALYIASGYRVIGTGQVDRFETVLFEKALV